MSITIELYSPSGVLLIPNLSYQQVDYTLVESDIGVVRVDGPLIYPFSYFAPDCQLRIKRSVYGGAPYLEGNAVWLLRSWAFSVAESGERSYSLTAMHVTSLLARRIVDYVSGSSESSQSGAADNLIKSIVDDNFVNPTDATRDMAGLSVGPNLSAAPTIDKSFAWRNTLEVIHDLCAASAEAGMYLGFEVQPSSSGFQVVTFTDQRGVDRSGDTSALFSLERRNLASGTLTYDYSDQATRMIGGGPGEGSERIVQRASDTVAQGQSPYGLIEAFHQATQQGTTAGQVLDEAEGELWSRRGRVRFSGAAQQVQGSLYGVNYQWGDIVPVSFLGTSIACRISTIKNRVARGSGEQLDIQLSNDTVI